MGLSIKDFVDTYAEIREAFDEEIPCEHSQHGSLGETHGGNAEWYGEYRCKVCGSAPGIQAFCTPWKEYVEQDHMVWCVSCRSWGKANTDFYEGRWTKR